MGQGSDSGFWSVAIRIVTKSFEHMQEVLFVCLFFKSFYGSVFSSMNEDTVVNTEDTTARATRESGLRSASRCWQLAFTGPRAGARRTHTRPGVHRMGHS